jgi:hypothetical protein
MDRRRDDRTTKNPLIDRLLLKKGKPGVKIGFQLLRRRTVL